jgi:hypothetical protein
LASKLASTDVLIESDLLPVGHTVEAGLGEISVTVATHASTPVPTATELKGPESKGSFAYDESNAENMTDGPTTLEEQGNAPIAARPAATSMLPLSPPIAMITIGACMVSFLVLVLGAVRLWRHLDKTWRRPLEIDHTGQIASKTVHVTISDVGPEGVKITIAHPDMPTGTEESSFGS